MEEKINEKDVKKEENVETDINSANAVEKVSNNDEVVTDNKVKEEANDVKVDEDTEEVEFEDDEKSAFAESNEVDMESRGIEKNYFRDSDLDCGFCPKCGNKVSKNEKFCPYCGQQLNFNSDVYDDEYDELQEQSRKKKLTKIIAIVSAVVVAVGITIAICASNCNSNSSSSSSDSYSYSSSNSSSQVAKSNFKTKYSSYSSKSWCQIGSDGSWMAIDTNPYDIDDYYSSEALSAIQTVLTDLGFSSATYQSMIRTRAIDGKQTQSNSKYTISWTYHPDNGLEVLFSEI